MYKTKYTETVVCIYIYMDYLVLLIYGAKLLKMFIYKKN